ncbi:MAG: Mur ligase family protein [Pseudomonadota bacterium]
MTLQDWLERIEQKTPQNFIRPGLFHFGQVAQRLNLRDLNCPVVTVGGTNGKGSTATLIANLWAEQKSPIGLYTSPHLHHFRERIVIDGKPVSDEMICQAFNEIEKTAAELTLTYFEFTTLAAFWIFRQYQVVGAVLEVGLGGRLDCVNWIHSDIAVITSIGLDHQNILGESLLEIAKEKSGIFRSGRLVVFGGSTDQEINSFLKQRAEYLSCPFWGGNDFSCQRVLNHQENFDKGNWHGENLQKQHRMIENLRLPNVPLNSIAVSLQTVSLMSDIGWIEWQESSIHYVLQAFKMPARFQILQEIPLVIADVAHNLDGVYWVIGEFQRRWPNFNGRLHLIFGAMQDKDWIGIINILQPYVYHWWLTQPNIPRATSVENFIKKLELNAASHSTLEIGNITPVLDAMNDNDAVLILGSFYVVEPFLKNFQNPE